MPGPASPGWLLVALCAATGTYCLLRMRSHVEEQRRAAGGEALMGFGMAVMAVPTAALSPPSWAWPVYATVFGAAALRTLWALWATRSSAHHLHHLVGAGAMVYMAVAMTASPAPHPHAHGYGGSGLPLLTGALLLYFTGYVLLSGIRLVPVAGVGDGDGTRTGVGALGWSDRPELARACRLSMGIGMLAMLLTM
ncbi:DUF5134 domain-containing protein [Streptomyces sp. NBC_01275]|uniref:DUF5134 domain-containing protein n=1 Tax=Streptomyces sp. NBC_01275 TaxID=2903807 RepID=UPI00225AB530|nr:DUF5134 domain-containing protein [Streptomyces sp. NBC_01275]MCX4759870.1 DUF5134 domain-containing protein [Streptomyces sp. NBC_01275]